MKPTTSRRRFLRFLGAAGLGSVAGGGLGVALARALGRPAPLDLGSMSAISDRPEDLETPLDALTLPFTPNDVFFVRSHHGPPLEPRADWALEVGGRDGLRLSLADLRSFPRVSLPAVLQCSGNGRAFFQPRVPGAQWKRGGVGQATWTGARLSDVLARASSNKGERFLTVAGADAPPMPTTPDFARSIPLDRAIDPTTLIAYEMNGEPMPYLHGAPARLVVPGWVGDDWVKWLRRIDLTDQEDPGFYMRTAYRLPAPDGHGTSAMTELPVKSIVARPGEGAVLRRGVHALAGVAFSGGARVARVEISVDGGRTWFDATLEGPDLPGAWRVWRATWRASTLGTAVICSRATDSKGATQTDSTSWNHGGYLWNAIDRVPVEVTS